MGTFGASLWGAGGTGSTAATVGVPLSSLILPAYRIAGITKRAMIVPSQDMYDEAIPELNRMLASWNCDGHKIFTTSIATYPLTTGQKAYTIGPGGDFNADRPLFIKGATVLLPTSPVIRWPMDILDDDEWRSVEIQDISGAPPYELYYDGGLDTNGRGTISIRFQPPDGYTLELYTWQRLQANFSSSSDIAIFPDGYEAAIVDNLGLRLAKLNPHMAALGPTAVDDARRSLNAIMTLNQRSPKMATEPGLCREYGHGRGWLDGNIR